MSIAAGLELWQIRVQLSRRDNTVRNAGSVDEFVCRGSGDPTIVQRIAASLFASCFVCGGIILWVVASADAHNRDWVVLLEAPIALAFLFIGVKIFRNFLAGKKPKP